MDELKKRLDESRKEYEKKKEHLKEGLYCERNEVDAYYSVVDAEKPAKCLNTT